MRCSMITYFKVQSPFETFWTSIRHVLLRVGTVDMTFAHAYVLNFNNPSIIPCSVIVCFKGNIRIKVEAKCYTI